MWRFFRFFLPFLRRLCLLGRFFFFSSILPHVLYVFLWDLIGSCVVVVVGGKKRSWYIFSRWFWSKIRLISSRQESIRRWKRARSRLYCSQWPLRHARYANDHMIMRCTSARCSSGGKCTWNKKFNAVNNRKYVFVVASANIDSGSGSTQGQSTPIVIFI